MITDHTIYVAAYGKMWSALSEVYPGLLHASKNIMNNYLSIYDEVSNQPFELPQFKVKRSALTKFIVHSMNFSSFAMERESIIEILEAMLGRMELLLEYDMHIVKGDRDFDLVICDFALFLREGWEVLCREEVWPECIQFIEKTLLQFKHDRNRGFAVNRRILIMLEDLLHNINAQGTYHSV